MTQVSIVAVAKRLAADCDDRGLCFLDMVHFAAVARLFTTLRAATS